VQNILKKEPLMLTLSEVLSFLCGKVGVYQKRRRKATFFFDFIPESLYDVSVPENGTDGGKDDG
jgi:hypothetical protein